VATPRRYAFARTQSGHTTWAHGQCPQAPTTTLCKRDRYEAHGDSLRQGLTQCAITGEPPVADAGHGACVLSVQVICWRKQSTLCYYCTEEHYSRWLARAGKVWEKRGGTVCAIGGWSWHPSSTMSAYASPCRTAREARGRHTASHCLSDAAH